MNAAVTQSASPLDAPTGALPSRIVWHARHNPKRELWLAWWTLVVFYNFFGLVFFVITRTQPPPDPGWDTARQVQWFGDNHFGILVGFAIMFLITGMTTMSNALIAYSMRRMSVSRVFAYSYLILYSLSAIPGLLLLCIVLTVGALRPDRLSPVPIVSGNPSPPLSSTKNILPNLP